jgi:predicted ATPase/class 3 adenylate cyclase/DNA-binding CsgD family transcriptional regulator
MREFPTGTVTLLFIDIEGSTRLLQQLGKRYAGVMETSRSLLRSAFLEFHGHEVDTQGDAFFVAFARATDAVSAAVVAQRSLFSQRWPDGITVRVRMGLHTGEPQHTTEGYVGLDVHHAARIMSIAHGGQVLLSQTTRDLVEHDLPEGVSLHDLGAHHLKDLQQPSRLFQLVIEGLPTDFPMLKTLDVSPNNLPLQPTPFIGREKEVEAVQQLLLSESSRLVTLTGPGGVGKTRLGLQVAANQASHFTDGTWFVSLAPISDPDLVIPAISQTLGLREARDQAPLEYLKRSLHKNKTLLLLDNFEQVVNAALSVADLLADCPRLKVLVTSREGLHVRAEREFPVPALALPDSKHLPDLGALSQYEAVALFLERAQAVKPDFQMTNANAGAVADICIRLDGLPLAIELAAARLKLLPPQALLKRLSHRLLVLTGGSRDLPSRQHTLRNTIQWSYDLLTEREQRLFRWLSIFVGGCMLEAAAAVCSAPGSLGMDILEGVTSLLDKSLLQQTELEGEEPRLLLLETLREYGLEVLETQGEREAAHQAHTTYYLALAEQAKPKLEGAEQGIWLERLEREHDNLRAVLEWALEQGTDEQESKRRAIALRLSAALEPFWEMRGYHSEARTYLERVLTSSEGESASLRANVLPAAAHAAYLVGDYERAEVLAQHGLALSRELNDTHGVARCLSVLVELAWAVGESAEAIALSEKLVQLLRHIGGPGEVAEALYNFGIDVSTYGEFAQGQALFQEALELARTAGNELLVGMTLIQIATFLFWGNRGDGATIRQRLQEGQALVTRVGHPPGVVRATYLAAVLAWSEGEPARAAELARETLALARKIDSRWFIAFTLHLLGTMEFFQGELTAARHSLQESLALSRELSSKHLIALDLESLGLLAARQKASRWAVQLWGAAEVLREVTAKPLPPVLHALYEEAVSAAHAQLEEEAFAAAWQEGRTMELSRVIDEALNPTAPSTPSDTPSAPAPRPVAAYPEGLTEREVEVLRLVAQGLTDAQVAEQLVISPRTVNGHLRSIYSKLGVTSRAAATRYTLDHHLA